MMLIDLHAHSKGISRCCKGDADHILEVTKNIGIEGIVLTNHYDKSYVINNDAYGFAEKYVEEYYYIKSLGEKYGLKVFFGIEVTMDKHNNIHMLIYGVNEEFVLKYPNLYDYTQEELYKIVKDNNGILVQAHHKRKGIDVLLEIKYLDGIEANCHPRYDGPHIEEFSKLAKNYNLLLTCGGDYHADSNRAKCGIYLPDDIKETLDIVDYLYKTDKIRLCIQEVDSLVSYDYMYEK